jgi:hypothetical protein
MPPSTSFRLDHKPPRAKHINTKWEENPHLRQRATPRTMPRLHEQRDRNRSGRGRSTARAPTSHPREEAKNHADHRRCSTGRGAPERSSSCRAAERPGCGGNASAIGPPKPIGPNAATHGTHARRHLEAHRRVDAANHATAAASSSATPPRAPSSPALRRPAPPEAKAAPRSQP